MQNSEIKNLLANVCGKYDINFSSSTCEEGAEGVEFFYFSKGMYQAGFMIVVDWNKGKADICPLKHSVKLDDLVERVELLCEVIS